MLQEFVLKADSDPNVNIQYFTQIYLIVVKGNGKTFSSGNDLRNFDAWPGLNQEVSKFL